jgi:hypothetical protein
MNRGTITAFAKPLVALALTLLVAAGAIVYSRASLDDARQHLAQRETRFKEARLRIHDAGAEKETITRYLDGYQELARAGFAGEEQRINWLEGLRRASEEARTFGVEYDIAAQRPYAYAAEFDAAPLQLNESLMRLRLHLLHEEDLPRFFKALARSSGGFFTVDRCVLRRLQGAETALADRAQQNLAAECNLRWLTARTASEKR